MDWDFRRLIRAEVPILEPPYFYCLSEPIYVIKIDRVEETERMPCKQVLSMQYS